MNPPVSHFFKDRILKIVKTGLMTLILLALTPVQGFAQALSCNSGFGVSIGDGTPTFVGDTVVISVEIRAGQIDGGSYLDIFDMVYGFDCADGEDITACASPGNTITFNDVTEANCIDSEGNAIDDTGLAVSDLVGELLGITTLPPDLFALRFYEDPNPPAPPGSINVCTIGLEVEITSLALDNDDGLVFQAFGWDLSSGVCDNDRTTGENNTFAISVSLPDIDIEKSTNGQDADTPLDAPVVLVGSTVNWEYVVTNTGNEDLSNIIVTDDRGVVVSCPGTTLAVGANMTCTGSGTAVAGPYANVADVVGTFATRDVTDSDPSHYRGILPSIEILKEISINGGSTYFDANDELSAPVAAVPSDALYRITVTNTGTVDLTNVEVTDDSIALASWPFTVPGGLAPGASFVIDSGVINALFVEERCNTAGLFTNVASVTADTVGQPSTQVSDEDPANLRCIQVDVAVPANQPLALLLLILGMSTMAALVIRRTS